jgi:hypothetical protein
VATIGAESDARWDLHELAIRFGWWLTYPSEKYESQLGFPIYGKIKNVPNHQPDTVLNIFNNFHTYSLKFGWISSF